MTGNTRKQAWLASGGLYAITDAALIGGEKLLPAVEAALRGGAGMIQYRDKGDDRERRESEAQALLDCCRRFAVPLIINDDVDLARRIGADGVHLGQADTDPQEARACLGPEAIIGMSGYNEASAILQPAIDYVAFGRLFASITKPNAPAADLQVFAQARQLADRPMATIGGIDQDNAGQVLAAGAQWLAVVNAVFAASDIENATRTLCQIIAQRI